HTRRPWAEVDADAADPLLAQSPGQPVEEGVGRAVGGLAVSAPNRGDRGRVDEEIQLEVGGRLAQMPSAPDLPGEDTIDFAVVEAAQGSGADLTGGMHDACQWR